MCIIKTGRKMVYNSKPKKKWMKHKTKFDIFCVMCSSPIDWLRFFCLALFVQLLIPNRAQLIQLNCSKNDKHLWQMLSNLWNQSPCNWFIAFGRRTKLYFERQSHFEKITLDHFSRRLCELHSVKHLGKTTWIMQANEHKTKLRGRIMWNANW